MSVDEKSRRRGAVGEITFIAPLRRGHAFTNPDTKESITYADRLRRVLAAFNDREDSYDGSAPVPLGLRAFRGIHFAHLVLLEGDTRFMFSVDFDGSASDYLAGLSTDVPWLLNMVFSACEGWTTVDSKPQVLAKFIEKHQVETSFWFAQAPALSVRDIEWLDSLRRLIEHSDNGLGCRDNASCAQQLQALACQAGAPRSFTRRLAQLYQAQPDPDAALEDAKQRFRALFEPMFQPDEWRSAYRESFNAECPK